MREKCQQHQPALKAIQPVPWIWPSKPWSIFRLCWTIRKLIIVDSHTKWMEVFPVLSPTSQITITKLRWTFSRFGLPQTIVTNNGTCFTNEMFQSYLQSLGIQHIATAPYPPQSNGMVCPNIQEKYEKEYRGNIRSEIIEFFISVP